MSYPAPPETPNSSPGPTAPMRENPDSAPHAERRKRPWRLGSQLYVAVLGGGLAVTAIAVINARRLQMPLGPRRLVLAVGLASSAVAAVLTALVAHDILKTPLDRWAEPGTHEAAGYANRLLGLGVFAILYWLQAPADRAYGQGRDDDEFYASLWWPGILAWILGGIAQIVLSRAVGSLIAG